MTWNDFIFSEKGTNYKIRHVAFWIIFSIIFFLQSIVPLHISDFSGYALYEHAFLSVIFYIPVCIISVYAFEYFLLQCLQKKRYLILIFRCIVLIGAIFLLNLLVSTLFLLKICHCSFASITFRKLFGYAFINTSHALAISLLILGFSFTKNWFLERKEIKNLTKQKIQNELQTYKANIYPEKSLM